MLWAAIVGPGNACRARVFGRMMLIMIVPEVPCMIFMIENEATTTNITNTYETWGDLVQVWITGTCGCSGKLSPLLIA